MSSRQCSICYQEGAELGEKKGGIEKYLSLGMTISSAASMQLTSLNSLLPTFLPEEHAEQQPMDRRDTAFSHGSRSKLCRLGLKGAPSELLKVVVTGGNPVWIVPAGHKMRVSHLILNPLAGCIRRCYRYKLSRASETPEADAMPCLLVHEPVVEILRIANAPSPSKSIWVRSDDREAGWNI
ncbi:uncharacterized protein PADG_12487 [Paracoccidioides brasiliensis Pb18]|uniref:Uncharacterized protein n=1 Tax=Paracoccidioides brasiliensis (strain Pb18) TaxID=502780 RepID=A0A0A0HRZ0_PARBD|nr:uncharacterized protein PADG_12487 [Paracoccidioides brasiliensis Pb18]KGM91422.1 hypothetical protein PADG_12487 [Paracoccidioides brasiliensis Pb18]